MKPRYLTLALAFAVSVTTFAAKKATPSISVGTLRTERMVNPLSVDTPEPRLGWVITSTLKDVKQTSCRIIVASTPDKAEALEGDLWDCNLVGDQSQWVKYAGKALRSNTPCYWRVKVSTNKGDADWSETAMWNVGLLSESDWRGQWIGLDKAMPWDVEDVHSRLSARSMRTEFSLGKTVKRAMLYISGLGLYEAYINGQRIGDRVLAPVATDYRRTVIYNAYDVTTLLKDDNAIAVTVSNGRFYTMQQNRKTYKVATFGYPKLRLNLVIEFNDGTKQTVATDSKWKLCADGPIRSANEYDGEVYDARKRYGEWTQPHYNDTAWQNAERVAIPYGTLRGAMTPGMTVVKTLNPVSVKRHGQGFIVDLGQNISGWLRVRMNGLGRGDSVKIVFAETLTADGNLYRDNLRHALLTDVYIADGTEKGQWWSPEFTYHGFRYAEIKGLKSLDGDDVQGEVVSDEMTLTGTFQCSDSILNKVYHNAVWGILDNYKGFPIDCPQRDERQPWLGDRSRGCFGEAFVFDNNTLYAKWTRDIVEAQREDGCIPDVAPAYWNYYTDNITWPSALPFAIEMMYNQYGDTAPLRNHYAAVKRWLDHMRSQYGKNGLMPRDKYGDWCVPPEEQRLIHSRDPKRVTNGTLIATAYYYRLNRLMERFATILGNDADALRFGEEADTVKAAFNRNFLTVNRGTSPVSGHLLYPDSTFYGNNTVTANLLPLSFGMIGDSYVQSEVAKNIIKNIITDNKGTISCGVIGVQWLMHGLSDIGRGDIAWLLATNKQYPSWGYMAEKGATTTWELWNGDTANPSMNSGNHVMLLGDLVSWIYERVAGIASDSVLTGFKHIVMRPLFNVDEIDDINASYLSIYGNIVSRWRKSHGQLLWHVEIPANTTAELHLPDGSVRQIGSGVYDIEAPLRSKSKAILGDEFLYKTASFPECHSASIAETTKGDLVAAYFGGTKERNPDVCIYVSRKVKGSDHWTEPMKVADGVMSDTLRKACWNPVVWQNPNGELQIYFKIGSSVADWTGWLVRSRDGGRSWSKREPLQENFLGPVKNKPILSHGRVIAPTSVEKGGWRLYFEYSDDFGKSWQRTDFVAADEGVKTIQPSLMTLSDGSLCAVARTRSEHIGMTFSRDNGLTWSKLRLIETPNNNSGLDAVTLDNGIQLLVCNDRPIPKGIKNGKGLRTPLSILLSRDGEHWKHWLTLEDSPVSQYSYPSVIQTSDGHVHCVYTWRRQRVKHVELLPPTVEDFERLSEK